MKNKASSRLLSFLLALLMIFGTVSPALAAGLEAPTKAEQTLESELTAKDGKLKGKLVVPRRAQVQTRSAGLFRAPAGKPGFGETTVKVNIVKHGIGTEPFNFKAVFGEEASKKITLYDDADGADPDEQEASFTATDETITFASPIPMQDVKDGEVSIEFEGSHVKGRLTYVESAANYSGGSNITTFKLDLYQIRNTDVVVTTKNSDGTVVANPTTGKIKLGSLGKEIAIPAQGATGEFDKVDSISVAKVGQVNADPGYSVECLENGVIVDKTAGKVYKPGEFVVDSKGIDATTLEFTEKPIVTETEPKIDDPENPGTKITDPDYVKVFFSKGEYGEISSSNILYVYKGVKLGDANKPKEPTVTPQKGWTHKGWNPVVATSYSATTEHVALYKPVEAKGKAITTVKDSAPSAEDGIENKNDLPDGTKYAWKENPDVSKTGPTTGTVVVTYPDKTTQEVTVNITVNPKNSDEAVIPYVPADKDNPTNPDDTNVPTTDKNGNPVDKTQYVIVAFKVSPDNSGSLSLGKQTDKAVISALVKKDSEWAKVTLPNTNDKG
ncbi:MAG: hypothetical protein KHX08_03590, partial [Clostridiales bacterium]|nr:hypothetical protein [Clostridiales bacterium]